MLGFGPLSSLSVADDGGLLLSAQVDTTLTNAAGGATASARVAATVAIILAAATINAVGATRISAAVSTTTGACSAVASAAAPISSAGNIVLANASADANAANRITATASAFLAPVTGAEQAAAGARGSVNVTLATATAIASGRLFHLPVACRIISPIGANRFLETKGCDVQTLAFPDRFTPEILDYAVNFRGVQPTLDPGENIVSADVTVTAGDIVVSEIDHDTGNVSFWLSGGTPVYQRLAVRVTTNSLPPRTYQAEATITCLP